MLMMFNFEAKTQQIGDYGLWKCKVSNQGFSCSDGGEAVNTEYAGSSFVEIS